MYRSVKIAMNEVGYMEKETPDQLDDKEANAGDKNFTKYARDLDEIIGFYFGAKQGLPWCDVFVDWCFVKGYGVNMARKLLCQPILSRGAGCKFSMEYYKDAGQLYETPEIGDQIFFQKNGIICHTGLVVDVNDRLVTTVEGNTSDLEGIVANGGCVRQKQYALDFEGIAGYGRPDYSLFEPWRSECRP